MTSPSRCRINACRLVYESTGLASFAHAPFLVMLHLFARNKVEKGAELGMGQG